MLPFTLQLLEAGLPLILVINIMDEAARLGISIDCDKLSQELGIPVVPAVSVKGEGIEQLRSHIEKMLSDAAPDREEALLDASSPVILETNPLLQKHLAKISGLLRGDYKLSHIAIAKLLAGEDEEMLKLAGAREGADFSLICREISRLKQSFNQPLNYLFWKERQAAADRLVDLVSTSPTHHVDENRQWLSRVMMNPITGIPILFAVLYIGLYLFVGKLGGGILVDLLQNRLFERHVNPAITRFFEALIPWTIIQDLFVHDYGIITLGVKYAVAIILPIVATFFVVFSLLEDTGYLPRLALLIDRFFKAIGLSGRAVIPLVLGFGCGTMATLVTRVLETRREKVLATFLLALAIPCSAQLGVVLGMLAAKPLALIIWLGVVVLVALFVGFVSSHLLKGTAASFYIEIPPLRLPKLSNIITKTFARMQWYSLEILPLFVLASVVIWTGRQVAIAGHSLFDWIILAAKPFVSALGLPPQASVAFLFGFFRRDYGAAGMYDLYSQGILGGVPLLVAMVTLTLFVPCMAQWLMMQKERGLRTTLAICGFIFPFAWLVGFTLSRVLNLLGVKL